MSARRNVAYALVLAALAVLVAVRLHQRKPTPEHAFAPEADAEIQTNTLTAAEVAKTSSGTDVPSPQLASSSTNAAAADALPREEKWRMAVEARNFQIDFWGKVVDQDGSPLGGVKVIASCRTFVAGTNVTGYTVFPTTNLVTA